MKGRALVAAAALAIGVAAGMLIRDLLPGQAVEAQETPRVIHIRFQAAAVPREKGEVAVFVVNQENGDLWRHDGGTSGYVKAAGPIK